MTDLLATLPVPLDEQISCIKRELRFRNSVYKRRVANGKMTRDAANREIRTMEAVQATLEALRERLQKLRAGGVPVEG